MDKEKGKKTTGLVEIESQEKKNVKDLAELAEKELHEEEEQKQVELIKKAIKQTLESIKEKEKERTKLNKEIKTLKQDIDNIRAGRLDLIAERQEKDGEAKKTSIIEVVKEKEVHHHHYHDRWYEPYKIYIKEYGPYNPNWWSTSVTCDSVGTDINCDTYSITTNSIAKDASIGTYKLDSGNCVTLT